MTLSIVPRELFLCTSLKSHFILIFFYNRNAPRACGVLPLLLFRWSQAPFASIHFLILVVGTAITLLVMWKGWIYLFFHISCSPSPFPYTTITPLLLCITNYVDNKISYQGDLSTNLLQRNIRMPFRCTSNPFTYLHIKERGRYPEPITPTHQKCSAA